jgi:sugar-phosphatase
VTAGVLPRPYRAVLFDVDGVLLDSEHLLSGAWSAWATSRALRPEWVLAHTYGRRATDTLREVAPHLDAEDELRVLDGMVLAGIDAVRPLPGAHTLLRALAHAPWAVVSSGTRWFVRRCFQVCGLPLPSVQVYGEDVRDGKPSPEGYLAATERLGVPPAECLVVEDAPQGVAAGKAAGCTVIAIATTHPADRLQAADVCLPDLVTAAGAVTAALRLPYDSTARTDVPSASTKETCYG